MKDGTAQKAKKGFFHIIFSRTTIVIVLLVLQILIFLGMIRFLEDYKTLTYVAFIIISVFAVIKIINRKGNPAFKMAWIIPIMISPIVGTIFYIFVELQVGTKYIGRRLTILGNETKA
ncbi:MAG: PLD nuclease N-terminal domain-containing protein, partial [Lachnospiraceae bacterium]